MGDKRRLSGILAFLAMLILILDGKCAAEGAYEGIQLCIKTVVPSLFPFFVLSNLMTNALIGTSIPFLRPVGKACSIPSGMECLLIPAFLGGYPVGAQTIAQGWRQGQIPKEEAERLMAFCNNAGPSFLFGMAASVFSSALATWILWGIQIISALIVAWIIPSQNIYTGRLQAKQLSLPESLRNAIQSMANVCGWILLFRILISFLTRWILWILPVPMQTAAIGILELSNGCVSLSQIRDPQLRFVICSGMLTFGGLCVMMQIGSAAKGLSLSRFFLGKCMQTMLSLLISAGLAYGGFLSLLLLILPMVLFFRKQRKNGSIPVEAGV